MILTMNILGILITPVTAIAIVIIIIAVGAWYLYELGKERGRKDK